MKEYFVEQFKDLKPLTKEIVEALKGRSYYSEYQEDDLIVAFFEQTNTIENDMPGIHMQLQMVVERDIDKLKNDFNYIRMSTKYPVLERIVNV